MVQLKISLLTYAVIATALSCTINLAGMIPIQVRWASKDAWTKDEMNEVVRLLNPMSPTFNQGRAALIPSINNAANADQLLLLMIPAMKKTNTEYSYNLIDALTRRIDQLDPRAQQIRFTQDHIPAAIILISGYNRINGTENKKLITWLTWFIKRGLPVDAPSRDDATILMYHATNQKRIDVVKLLLQNGAKPDTITKTFQNDQVPVLTSAQRARDHAFKTATPEEYKIALAIATLLEKPEQANQQTLFLKWLQNRKTLAASIVGAIALYSGYRWLTSSPKAELNEHVLINKTGTHIYIIDGHGLEINPLENGNYLLPDIGSITIKLDNNEIKPIQINLDQWTEKRKTHYLNITITKRWIPRLLSRWFSSLTYTASWTQNAPFKQD